MHSCETTLCNEVYRGCEHIVQSTKACCFDNNETLTKIMNSANPYEAKRLEYRVHNHVEQMCQHDCEQLIYEDLQRKFIQNNELKQALKTLRVSSNRKRHKNRKIGHCNPKK